MLFMKESLILKNLSYVSERLFYHQCDEIKINFWTQSQIRLQVMRRMVLNHHFIPIAGTYTLVM